MSYMPENSPTPSQQPPATPSPEPVAPVAQAAPAPPARGANPGMVIAIIWAIVAVIIGIVVMAGAQEEAYGGDAYTGIQNTGAQTVRALGWLIISTGPIGLIIAASRR